MGRWMEQSDGMPLAPLWPDPILDPEQSPAARRIARCSREVSEIDRELEAALEYKLAFGGADALREVLDLIVEVLGRRLR